MFSDTEPEPAGGRLGYAEQEPSQPLFISFEEQFGHLFKSNIGI